MYPDTGQQTALAKAFGCARVVFNDAVRAREDARKAELPFPKVRRPRTLPTAPTSVTLIKDAAGRYFASFVIDTDPAADQARMPETDRTVGIDLGLTHFAVLSDGT
ncbi:hypothetical protein GCM10022384_26130 [Streptomyces marokkonensis]|uniref:Transposase putative helix-turn-helix domain-containing protein n=1 Tax=Streptomyces marokkonensis TaxID=324855 RepID=A0ABP7Q0J4_9ACTN